jgi:dipeptidyl aminopeptidase/acylaminoacyl peptidase
MRANLRKPCFLLAALVACGGSDGPVEPIVEGPAVPPLESVSFTLLGSGKVAFQRIGPLSNNYVTTYVIDATASSSSHIFDNELAEGPVLSPDGQRLTFLRYTGLSTNYDVHIAKIDGTGMVQVTRFAQEGTPHWTPDGSKLVLTVVTQQFPDVFSQSPVANASDLTQLTHFTPGPGGVLTCPFLFGSEGRISISNEGKITFACAGGGGEIDVLAPNGTLAAAYLPSRTDPTHWPNVYAAEWSPDGTRVAFIESISDRDAGLVVSSYSLKVMNGDATNVTTLATVPVLPGSGVGVGGGWAGPGNVSLCWMPDGSRLVFTIPEKQLVGHLWVVRADGSGLMQLTSTPDAFDRSVSCSRS